jgi:hypothetical protein
MGDLVGILEMGNAHQMQGAISAWRRKYELMRIALDVLADEE